MLKNADDAENAKITKKCSELQWMRHGLGIII